MIYRGHPIECIFCVTISSPPKAIQLYLEQASIDDILKDYINNTIEPKNTNYLSLITFNHLNVIHYKT